MHPAFIVLITVVTVIVILGLIVLILRETLPAELDDVHPDIDLPDEAFAKADTLFVIPFYNGVPISSNTEFCEKLKKSGKKLCLHGVTHTFGEFAVDRSEEYIQLGIDEFTRAFGYPPTNFKAPKLQLTSNNRKILVESKGLYLHGRFGQIIHKVAHVHQRISEGRLPAEHYETPVQTMVLNKTPSRLVKKKFLNDDFEYNPSKMIKET